MNEPEPTPAAERASRSSFYTAMRILPRAQREAMFEIYSFCRAVDDIADDLGPRDPRRAQLQQWRGDIDAVYGGAAPPPLAAPGAGGARIRPQARGFHRRHRRHGDGRGRRHPRTGPRHARPLLRPGRLRGRTPFGARVRNDAEPRAVRSPIIWGARCSSPTFCAISTRTLRSGGSTCRARRCRRPASPPPTRPSCWRVRRCGKPATPSSPWRRRIFAKPRRSWRRTRAASCARRASWGRPIAPSSMP